MKKLLFSLWISALFSAFIYSADSCDSETSFQYPITRPALRAPACGRTKTSPFQGIGTKDRNANMHILGEIVTQARRAMGGKLFDTIPEYRKQKDPKQAFIIDYCFSDLEILAKAHGDLDFKFDHDKAIEQIIKVAPEIADSTFKAYAAYENDTK